MRRFGEPPATDWGQTRRAMFVRSEGGGHRFTAATYKFVITVHIGVSVAWQHPAEKSAKAGQCAIATLRTLARSRPMPDAACSSANRPVWVRRLDDELDNIRAALGWLTQTDASAAADVATGLWWFWFRRGLWHRGSPLARNDPWRVSRRVSEPRAGPDRARHAQLGPGRLRRRPRAAAAKCCARPGLGLDEDLAIALMFTSMDMLGQCDAETAKRLVEESVARLRPLREQVGLGLALASVGAVALASGDYAGARGPLEESVQVLRMLDDAWGLALPLRNRGLVAYREGDLERAAELIRESITTLASPGDPWFGARGLEALATIAVARGDFVRAARCSARRKRCAGPRVRPYRHTNAVSTTRLASSYAGPSVTAYCRWH